MFGKNEIVGQKFFKEITDDRMFVTSIFYTLQGEGPYRGLPAVFVRLAKCNLNCSFCDTFFDNGDWLTFDEIDYKITQTIKKFYKDRGMETPDWAMQRRMVLVMTGGEPMLQKKIGSFLDKMQHSFDFTQIESNGTLVQDIPKSTTLVVSPKCSEKNGVPLRYLAPKPEMLARADCLKFVMSADQDSPYSSIPQWAHDWAASTKKQVFVSPMNIYNTTTEQQKILRAFGGEVTLEDRSTKDEVVSFWESGLLNMEENEKNHLYSAEYCMQYGFIMNLQVHLYAGLA